MLIRPQPLPDEQDRGYHGRVMRLNGVARQQDMDAFLREWAELPGPHWRGIPRVALLSQVAGMPVRDFMVGHTLLPLRRGITSYRPELPHGCESNPQMLCSASMRLDREGAYFCERCLQEDIALHGQSYWRREHQIPGLFWCRTHSVPLRHVAQETAFQRPPSAFIETTEPLRQDWIRDAMDNPAVNRYLEICSALLNREKPLAVRNVSLVLRERARTHDYQVNGGTVRRPLLSDLALERFGRPWLSTVLPALAAKEAGAMCYPLDGVFFMQRSASSALAYVIVSALLYKSADEALGALESAPDTNEQSPRKRKLDITTEELVTAYVGARGDWMKAARNFDCAYQTVSSRYASLGLPNLGARGATRPFDALFAFYAEKKRLSESAAIGGMTPEALEDLVRFAGANLKDALLAIRYPKGPGFGTRRVLRVNPDDVQ